MGPHPPHLTQPFHVVALSSQKRSCHNQHVAQKGWATIILQVSECSPCGSPRRPRLQGSSLMVLTAVGTGWWNSTVLLFTPTFCFFMVLRLSIHGFLHHESEDAKSQWLLLPDALGPLTLWLGDASLLLQGQCTAWLLGELELGAPSMTPGFHPFPPPNSHTARPLPSI